MIATIKYRVHININYWIVLGEFNNYTKAKTAIKIERAKYKKYIDAWIEEF